MQPILGSEQIVRLDRVRTGMLGLQAGFGHGILDDLDEVLALFARIEIGDPLVGGGTLVVIEDSDLLHGRIEDAPAGALSSGGFFGARRSRFLCRRLFLGGFSRRRGGRLDGYRLGLFSLLAQLAPIHNTTCHVGPSFAFECAA